MKRASLAIVLLLVAITQAAAGFFLLTNPATGGGPGLGLVVVNQSIRFGNKTPALAGLATVVSSGDLIVSTNCTGTNSTDFTVGATGSFVPSTAGASGQLSHGPYTLSCTFNSTVNATVTINIDADASDVGPTNPASEFAAALNAIGASAVPRSIYLRPAILVSPSSDNWIKSRTWTGLVTIESRDHSNMGVVEGADPSNIIWTLSNIGYLKFYYVGISCVFDRTQMSNGACMTTAGAQRGPVYLDHVDFYGTSYTILGPGQHFGGLISSTTGTFSDVFSVTNSTFHDADYAFRPIAANASTATFTFDNNVLYNIGLDYIHITGPMGANGGSIQDNEMSNPFIDQMRASFTGVTGGTHITHTGALTGAADGTKALIGLQLEFNNVIGALEQMFTLSGITISRTATGFIHVTALDTGGATVIDMTSANTVGSYRRVFVLLSLDTTGTSRLEIFREGTAGTGAWTLDASTTAASQVLDLTGTSVIGVATGNHTIYWSYASAWQGQTADVTDPAVQALFAYPATVANSGQWIGMWKPLATQTGVYGSGADWLVGFAGNYVTVWVAGANQANGGNYVRSGTIELAHGDFIQFLPGADISNWTIKRNAMMAARDNSVAPLVQGSAQFDSHIHQCIFNEDITTAFHYINFDIEYNVCAGLTIHGVSLYNPQDSILGNNTVVIDPSWTADYTGQTPTVGVRQHQAGTGINNNVVNNVAGDNALFGTGTLANNQKVRPNTTGPCSTSSDCPYADLFVGDGTGHFEAQSIAQLKAWFSAKPGGLLDTASPKIGALFGGNFGP